MQIKRSLAKKLAQSIRPLAVAALLVGSLLQPDLARADHSIGRPCIDCHSLRSTNVVPGSRNVKESQVDDPLYKTSEWYNTTPWVNDAAKQPLDCSYCHSEDIASEIRDAYGGKLGKTSLSNPPKNTGINTSRKAVGSAHPVDVIGDHVYYDPTVRITCNDCHNGPSGSPKITPYKLDEKSDTDGYPNHIDAVVSPTALPGENDLVNNPPQLTAYYGPGAVWSKPSYVSGDLLCFICHDGSDATKPPFSTNLAEVANGMTNIMAEYSMTGGGHNVQGIGKGIGSGGIGELKRVPCYNCHDPHSGVAFGDPVRANESLITATAPGTPMLNPYETTASAPFTFDGYKTAAGVKNDRGLCLTCHAKDSDPQATIEGNTPVRFMNPITVGNLAYGFHTNAHATVQAAGNCLQSNGGCHQSPHNTSPYDCLGCHNSNLPNYAKFPPALQAVAHVNSDFGLLDATGQLAAPNYNGIKSRHDIPYNKSGDISSPVNNGCLACHNVPGSVAGNLGKKLAVAGTIFDDLYGGANRITYLNSLSDRESLNNYDRFCLECHKGITSSDPSRQLGSYYPPQTNNQYDYFYKGGHGTGKGGETFTSGNSQAKIGCVECHMYHGSTAHKLLPGDVQTTDNNGKVVKGFDYGAAPTLASKQSIGGVESSKKIDYTDYTMRTNGNDRLPDDKRRSFKYANYTISSSWNTYYEDIVNPPSPPAPPTATRISFGTAGDKIINGGTAVTSASDKKVGFCNTCHLYKNTTNGTNQTADWVSTHEGAKGAAGIPADFPSKRLFFKDCTECHDPHGSGDKNSDDANAYMVRGKIITDSNVPVDGSTPKVYDVVFKRKSGIDSGDEYYSAGTVVDTDKRDNLCAVCHTATDHNTRETVKNHNAGGDCFLCHPHGDKNKYVFPGFPGVPVGGCDGCHGYPPQRLDTSSRQVPPEENYTGGGGPHVEHVNLLGAANSLVKAQYKDNYSDNTKMLCGPCHGELAPEHTSGNSSGAWDPTARSHVNIGQRTAATTSWGASPKYNNQALPVAPATVMADPSGSAMSMTNSVCTNVDCHPMNPVKPEQLGTLAWYSTTLEKDDEADTLSNFNPQDAPNRTKICFDCHDITPPDIRIYDYAGTQVYGRLRDPALANMYDPKKINVAANYFGTLSEFGRGGHGDYRLSQAGLDVNSASTNITQANPIDCTACHNWTATHFSLGTTEKSFRLRNPVLETGGHGNTGLCNQTGCHPGAQYPGTATGSSQSDKYSYKHHPSYRAAPTSGTKAINKSAATSTWAQTGSTWSQSGYSPSGTLLSDEALFGSSQLRDIDYFTDWYNRGNFWNWTQNPSSLNHNQSEPQGSLLNVSGALMSYTPRPTATLPLAKAITGAGADGDYFLCVTCHNPHGTDLYVHLGSGGSVNQLTKDSADNNMLRLKADDNRLCIACH